MLKAETQLLEEGFYVELINFGSTLYLKPESLVTGSPFGPFIQLHKTTDMAS